jgi:hypothetical protein
MGRKMWHVVALLAAICLIKGLVFPLFGWGFTAAGLVDIYTPYALFWLKGGLMLAAFAALLRWARP